MKKLLSVFVILFLFGCDHELKYPLVVERVDAYSTERGTCYIVYVEHVTTGRGLYYFQTKKQYNVGDTIK